MNKVFCDEIPQGISTWNQHKPKADLRIVYTNSLIFEWNKSNHREKNSNTKRGRKHERQEYPIFHQDQIIHMIKEAGRKAVERDTLYENVEAREVGV